MYGFILRLTLPPFYPWLVSVKKLVFYLLYWSSWIITKGYGVDLTHKHHIIKNRCESYRGLCEGEELVVDAHYTYDLCLKKFASLSDLYIIFVLDLFLYCYLAHTLKGFLVLDLFVQGLVID